jgi:hypothetical protein
MNKSQKASVGVLIIGIILFLLLLVFFIVPGKHPGHFIEVKQKAQFHSISAALELFQSAFDRFPLSDGLDSTGKPYCGIMKLTEAIAGQDLMGFHMSSIFRHDGKDSTGMLLYDTSDKTVNFALRKGPYLPIENANIYHLKDIFENTGPFDGNEYVMCDTFIQKRHSGKKTGMSLLYYKADKSKNSHDVNNPDNPDNIYNYKDNYDLLALGVPGKPGVKHPLYEDSSLFYIMTQNYKGTAYNKDTYILLSAGKDGLYGTEDDIANFDFEWRPKK